MEIVNVQRLPSDVGGITYLRLPYTTDGVEWILLDNSRDSRKNAYKVSLVTGYPAVDLYQKLATMYLKGFSNGFNNFYFRLLIKPFGYNAITNQRNLYRKYEANPKAQTAIFNVQFYSVAYNPALHGFG